MNYRQICIKHNGPIPKDELGRSFDIHHINGDHSDNSPTNLKAVSLQEHFDIHQSQGDKGACLAIARRMKLSPEEISKLSSATQKRNVANGSHTFAKPGFQKSLQEKLIKEGRHLSQTNPEQHKANARKAGEISGERLKKTGWSAEAIAKRVETRSKQNNWNRDMSAANTPEAIAKRVAARKATMTLRAQANTRQLSCGELPKA